MNTASPEMFVSAPNAVPRKMGPSYARSAIVQDTANGMTLTHSEGESSLGARYRSCSTRVGGSWHLSALAALVSPRKERRGRDRAGEAIIRLDSLEREPRQHD